MDTKKLLYVQKIPMIPYSLEKYISKLLYPLYVQPKLDGFRCLSYYLEEKDEIIMRSLKGKQFENVNQFMSILKPFFKKYPNFILDGELYFQGKSSHAVQHEMSQKNPNVSYIIFDVFDVEDPNEIFENRWKKIKDFFPKNSMNNIRIFVHILPTILIKDQKELEKMRENFIKNENMEGIIVRIPNGLYEWNKRSKYILKSKNFYEDLFKIISLNQCKGMCEGAALFQLQCLKDNKKTFWANGTGTLNERRKIYKNSEKYIGKKVYVRYYLIDNETGCVSRNPIVLIEKGFYT